MNITVKLFYHLKEKTGTGEINLDLPDRSTIADVKKTLELQYPQLRTHLGNVMILMNQKIVLDDDRVQNDAEVSFLTPVGGG